MSKTIQSVLVELRRALEAFYGPRLSSVMLFGSHARGEAAPESDIDVLVVLKGPVNPGEEILRTGGIVADLSWRVNGLISCVFMDEARYRHRNGPLLRNVRREGVAV
jgi:predicted nucleotidyltransferase